MIPLERVSHSGVFADAPKCDVARVRARETREATRGVRGLVGNLACKHARPAIADTGGACARVPRVGCIGVAMCFSVAPSGGVQ